MTMEAYGHPRDGHSAMALTVGLPVAITAKMILDGKSPPLPSPLLPPPHVTALSCHCPRLPEEERGSVSTHSRHLPTHLGRAERGIQGLGQMD